MESIKSLSQLYYFIICKYCFQIEDILKRNKQLNFIKMFNYNLTFFQKAKYYIIKLLELPKIVNKVMY